MVQYLFKAAGPAKAARPGEGSPVRQKAARPGIEYQVQKTIERELTHES